MRFTLRKGVKFHSGNTLTAKDVQWTFDRLKGSPDFKAIFDKMTMKTVDDHTVDIVTERTVPAGPAQCDLHLSHGFRVLFGHGRQRQ